MRIDTRVVELRRGPNAGPLCTPALALAALAAAILFGASPALATFHFMHAELVVVGVNGDPEAQAIQFRMRVNGQNLLDKARLFAWDAAGENKLLLIDFKSPVANGDAGDRVLAVTQRLLDCTDVSVQPDFVLCKPIPESYLAAGSLTFENDAETLVVCRLSWGGTHYTGSTKGAETNDDNGDFGPPLAGSLVTDGLQGWQYMSDVAGLSSTNLDDYALTDGPATLTNNAGQQWTLQETTCLSPSEADPPHCDAEDTSSEDDGDEHADEEDDHPDGDHEHPDEEDDHADEEDEHSGDEVTNEDVSMDTDASTGEGTTSPSNPPPSPAGPCGSGAPLAVMMTAVGLTLLPRRRESRGAFPQPPRRRR